LDRNQNGISIYNKLLNIENRLTALEVHVKHIFRYIKIVLAILITLLSSMGYKLIFI